MVIAENEHNDPRIWKPGGWGLDGFWYDDFHHAVHAALTGERRGYYHRFGGMVDIGLALVGSCDPPPADHCVACIQNHDQIGNRALGERLGHLVSPGKLRLAAAYVDQASLAFDLKLIWRTVVAVWGRG